MPLSTTDAIRILSGIQRIDPEMPLQQALCLFVIAEAEDGLSLTDLAKKVGIGLATASRYVGALGKMNRRHTEGLNFIESHEDPMERRKKVIKITIRGKNALRRILGEDYANLQKREELHGLSGEHGGSIPRNVQDQGRGDSSRDGGTGSSQEDGNTSARW